MSQRRHVIKDNPPEGFKFHILPEHILIDIDDKKAKIHVNSGSSLATIQYRENEDECEFENIDRDILGEIIEDALLEYQPMCDDVVRIIIGYYDLYDVIYNLSWPPKDDIRGFYIKELKNTGDRQKTLQDQPWFPKLQKDDFPDHKLYKMYNNGFHDLDAEFTWATWETTYDERYRKRIKLYTPHFYTLSIWGGCLYTITGPNNLLLGYYYDSSVSLQIGDSHTAAYLLDDKHVIVNNYGDVSSVIFLEKYVQ